MKMTEQERRQSVPSQEVSATRHIDDVSDDELEGMTYTDIAKLKGITVRRETISSRCRSGKSKREASTLPNMNTEERKSQFTKDCEAMGFHPSTIRRRMEAQDITFEEAVAQPVKSREQCGKAAAKKRWGGAK